MRLLRLLLPVLLALMLLWFIQAGLALADGPLSWQKLPGPEGGSVQTIVFDPTNANIIYIGTNSGVLKSTDGGATWLLPGGADSRSIFAYNLVVDPLTPTTLYAAGAEAGTAPIVYKSVDGGQSWQATGTGWAGQYGSLAINPVTPTILYVGTPNGVVKSTDAGQSWQVAGIGLGNKQVLSLAIDPVTPEIVYAGTVNDGIYKSIDGGQNWQAINNGSGTLYGRSLAINPITPTTIYAAGGGVRKSIDGGQTWQATGQTDADFVIVNPITPSTLYAGAAFSGASKSVDGGANWTPLNLGIADAVINAIAVNPNQPDNVYVGTYNYGLLKSSNGGATWQTSNSGLSQRVMTVGFDPISPTTIYAGGIGVSKSVDGGQNWQVSPPNPAGFFGVWRVVIDPVMPSTLYIAGNTLGAMGSEPGVFRSHDAGISWTPIVNGLPGLSFINVMAIHPVNPSILYAAGSGGVFKTSNQGDTWTPVNNGFNESTANALAMDPTAPDTLYAGGNQGGVYKTVDGGQNWQKIKQFDSGDPYTIVSVDVLAINPVTPTVLYAATKKQDSNPISRVFMSTDGGANWQDLQLYVLTAKQMLVDPNSPGVLYVATEAGVLQYTDAGWESAGLQHTLGVSSLDFIPGSDPPALMAGTESGLYFTSLPPAASGPIDLALTKSVTPTLAAPGQVVTYTLTFTNLGSGSVSRADFFDQITPPGGATNIRSSLPITLGVMSPQMEYSVGAIPPGGSGVITYNVTLWTPMPVEYVVSSNASIHGIDTTGATDPITANNTSVVDITIKNVPPRLSFISPKTVNEGSLLAFSLNAYDDNGTPLTYWLVNAPAGAALQSGNQFRWTPTEVQGPGVYTVTFIASDGVLTGSQTVPLTVNEVNQPPVAAAGPDQSVQIGAVVTLNGSGSFDPDGQPLTCGWRQTGGPAITLNQADAVSATFTAPVSPAVLTFSLTVTDSFGVAASANTTVTVSDLPPGGLQVNADVLSLLGHQTYFTSSLVSGSNPVFTWAFGDGDTGSGAAISHNYVTAGLYTTTVTSTNAAGSVANSIRVRVVRGEALLPVSPDRATAAIIPIGQYFTASLAAPAGAVTNEQTLVFSSTVSGPGAPAGRESIGVRFLLNAYQGIDLLPAQTFASPLRLALTYTNQAIAGMDENSLRLAHWTGETWAETGLTLVERQPAENQLDYEVAHLTEFALFGEKLKTYLPVILK